MKLTFREGQSLRALLAERGVAKKDLRSAVDQVVALNGLASARDISDGTVLTIPAALTFGSRTVTLKKTIGDVQSRAVAERPATKGGRAMGSLGIFAFDDLGRRGGVASACGPAHPPWTSGCSVSTASDSGGSAPARRSRRTSSSNSGVASACGPATPPRSRGRGTTGC